MFLLFRGFLILSIYRLGSVSTFKTIFSGSMPTSSGEEVSTGELKNVLKEIVDGEDKRKPYTDDELVELMNKRLPDCPPDDCKVSSVAGYSGGPTS